MGYSIDFSKLGAERTDGTFQVYLRYYQLRDGKKQINYLPTGHYLLSSEIDRLKIGKLSGETADKLYNNKKTIIEAIEGYYNLADDYPTFDQLKKAAYQQKSELSKGVDSYKIEYFEGLRKTQSETSILTYGNQLRVFIRFLEKQVKLNPKYLNLSRATANTTVEQYHDYLAHEEKKSAKYIKFLVHQALLFCNYIRKKRGEEQIIYKEHYKIDDSVKSEKSIELTDDEISLLISYDIDKNVSRIDSKRNLIWVQDVIKLNTTVGLRISEILSIEKDKIEDKGEYIVIKIFEKKKGKFRNIVVVDQLAVAVLRKYMANGLGKIFAFADYNVFNRNFKRLAKTIGGTFLKDFSYAKQVSKNTKIITAPRWKLMHSHALRSVALSALAKKSLVLARQYSGHSDFRTLKKHYIKDNYTEQELLEMLSETK